MLYTILITLLVSAFGAINWRFRGGAFTKLTGIDPGTDGARALGALMLSLPVILSVFPSWYQSPIFLIPLIFLYLITCGWGGYTTVYHTPPGTNEHQPWDWILNKLGLKELTLGRNLAGLYLNNAWLWILIAGWLALVTHSWLPLLVILPMSVAMPLAYYLAFSLHLPKPQNKFFDSYTAYGEFIFGALFGPQLFWVSKYFLT
jgi:hypothetical protein